jgi:hypothetical protein
MWPQVFGPVIPITFNTALIKEYERRGWSGALNNVVIIMLYRQLEKRDFNTAV